MLVYLVWVELDCDKRDLYGIFSSESRAQDWVSQNIDTQEQKYLYVETEYVD